MQLTAPFPITICIAKILSLGDCNTLLSHFAENQEQHTA